MSKQLVIEEESGTTTARRHPHNGYYAGDFSAVPVPGPRHVLAPTSGTVGAWR